LVAAVHPADWLAPTPAPRYNLVVIGGGPAGLVAALGAIGLGARVALVERHLLGGDCLNFGCVPSKALLQSARAVRRLRDAAALGVHLDGTVRVDFGAVMERMRAVRADLAHHDSAARLADAGIDVFLGDGHFLGPDTVGVGEHRLRFARALIATGARAARPPIPGLDQVDVLTNETIFELTELPQRLVVIGAGPIGAELAQAFALLGSTVTLVDRGARVLPREEPEASALVQDALIADGVELLLDAQIEGLTLANGQKRVAVRVSGAVRHVDCDAVLLAAGRQPNVEGLDLETAGVAFTARGVQVNDHLQTTQPNIYACGDVASAFQFTHAADFQARIVLQNALFFGRKRVSSLVIPWVTYTSPEVAHVGMSTEAAQARADLTPFTVPLADVDRARADGDIVGYARVFADKRGRIHSATIVTEDAGELLAELTLAMTHGLSLGAIASTLHPYPTRSELLFKVASAYNRTRLPARVLGWFKRLLAWRR